MASRQNPAFLPVKSNLIRDAVVRIVPAMSKHLLPILSAVVLLTAPVSADDKLDQLRKDAEAGKAQAQFSLGVMYANGRGVEKDYAEAVKWYRKAADQGYASAQSNIGLMYDFGEGMERDYAVAVKWYRKAAEQGHAKAQNALGSMYNDGHGVEKDYAEAVKWYRNAAERGFAVAQSHLGLMYQYGHGVEKDYVDAYAWFNLAAANGHEEAGENRNALEKQMSPQQIADAQKRTKELKKLIADKQKSDAPRKPDSN